MKSLNRRHGCPGSVPCERLIDGMVQVIQGDFQRKLANIVTIFVPKTGATGIRISVNYLIFF